MLTETNCHGFVKEQWAAHYASRRGRPSLREFLRLGPRERVPDHSWLSRTRARLPVEVHGAVFDWVLARLAEHGLIHGERIGVDASTMEANAALRTIVRRDSGETYRRMLHRMAEESGIATPTADDLVRLDRARKGKKLSNDDSTQHVDPDARITKMKDGTTHLADKPEHAVHLDIGAIHRRRRGPLPGSGGRRPRRHRHPARYADFRGDTSEGARPSASPIRVTIRATS